MVEYKEMSDELEQFLVELVHLSEKDEEHLQLAKVDDHSDLTVFSDREFIPLIKEACDRELKSFATLRWKMCFRPECGLFLNF